MQLIKWGRWGLGLVCLMAGLVQAQPLQIYVSPEGNALADGLAARQQEGHGPLGSIQQARDAIRKLKAVKQIPAQGVIIHMAKGVYPFTQPVDFDAMDSGNPNGPIIYRGQGMNTTVFTGAVQLVKHTTLDAQALALLPEKSRNHVLCYDLEKIGPEDLPGFAAGGAGFATSREYPVALSQQGIMLPLAQWPNDGYALTGPYEGPITIKERRQRHMSGVFHFDDPRMTQWSDEPDLWVYGQWYWHWADQRMQVQAVDLTDKTIAIMNPQTHSYGYKQNQPFYVFNAISELDQPGEWAINRQQRQLYVWPENDVEHHPLSLSVTQSLLQINGASDIRFEGLAFQQVRGDAIGVKDATRITFARCVIRQAGGWAMRIDGGSDGTVIGCDMDDLGEGGVALSGGELATLTPSNHRVENCYIHHFGRNIATYRPAVSLRGIGSIARNNLIHDTDHAAILFDGNDHLIEMNIIHDVLLHTSDAGAIYTCARNWAKRGTIIRNNLIHAPGIKLDPTGVRGIYLDDHTSGTLVQGNIVTMASDGIYIGGGKDNVIDNNLLLQCECGFKLGSRGTDTKKPGLTLNSREWKSTLAYPIDTPLWKQRYPDIRKWLQGDPADAHNGYGNSYTNNIEAACGPMAIHNKKAIMESTTLQNNVSVKNDPGLVDAAGLDFRFVEDSPIVKDMPQFKLIPVEKMGLYASPDRASPARRYGPDVKPLPAFKAD